MGIIINLDVMMAKRKISLTELAERIGITNANLSILKNKPEVNIKNLVNSTLFFASIFILITAYYL